MECVTRRWKNLRACFSREFKRQNDPKFAHKISFKRRKYVHYDALSFLISESDIEDNEDTAVDNEIDLPECTRDDNTSVAVRLPVRKPKTRPRTRLKTTLKSCRKESTSNSENAKASTDGTNAQTSTDSVNAQVSTDSVNAQVSVEFIDQQISGNSVNGQVSTNSANAPILINSDITLPWPDLVVTNILPDCANNPSTSVTNTPLNNINIENLPFVNDSLYNSTNPATNTTSNFVNTVNPTNFIATASSSSVNNPSSDFVNSVNLTNFVTNTSSNSVNNISSNFVNSVNPVPDTSSNFANTTKPASTTTSNPVMVNVHDTDSTSFALSLVPMLNMLSVDDKVECQINILSAILPYVKKSKEDKSREERRKRIDSSTRQLYATQRPRHIVDTLEIRSDTSDDELLSDIANMAAKALNNVTFEDELP